MKYSIIVPVYNRPDETEELLASLCEQARPDMQVIIVEDGSQIPCEDVVKRYAGRMNVEYFNKENGGPAVARNFGAQHAKGEYLIILDSDVVVPQGYLAAIDEELAREACDAFGGPDRAAESFTPVQKAISYSMTSFFTTGGIRGGKKKMDKFYPRSFNMGIRRDVYTALGGFAAMRFGEDIDFSYRIVESGYKVRLFPAAWVCRRTVLQVEPRAACALRTAGIGRLHRTRKKPPRRVACRSGGIRATNRIRHGILDCRLQALRTETGRVCGIQQKLL